jgi:hypothetical protein
MDMFSQIGTGAFPLSGTLVLWPKQQYQSENFEVSDESTPMNHNHSGL